MRYQGKCFRSSGGGALSGNKEKKEDNDRSWPPVEGQVSAVGKGRVKGRIVKKAFQKQTKKRGN